MLQSGVVVLDGLLCGPWTYVMCSHGRVTISTMGRGDPGSPRVPAVGAAPQLDWFWKRTRLCRVIGHDMDVFFRGDATPELYTYLNEGTPRVWGNEGWGRRVRGNLAATQLRKQVVFPAGHYKGGSRRLETSLRSPFLRNTVFEIYG